MRERFRRLCPTFADESFLPQLRTASLAFLLLIVVGFAASLAFPQLADKVLALFTDKIVALGMEELSDSEMFSTLLTNNLIASLTAVFYGILPFAYLSAAVLGTNALLLGAFAALYQREGLGLLAYLAGILPHGIFELSALVISCALGLSLCRVGTERLLGHEAPCGFLARARDCFRLFFLLVFPLLVLAALVETYVTPLILSWFL